MKLIFLTKYTRKGASSRYRSLQYVSYIDIAGLSCTVNPLFDDVYLEQKYAYGHVKILHVLRAFTRRLWAVLTLPVSAVAVIEYELLPWFPAILERWLALRGCPIVVDYDDALFHQYDTHRHQFVRRLLGRKIATVMRLADVVVTGNAYLAEYALRAGARRVEVIPTVINLERYPLKGVASPSAMLKIGWIGSPSTACYLHAIAPALAQVCRESRAQVCLVGSGPVDLPGIPAELTAWQEETEVDEIRSFDVGIMPLPDEPWARGKCGFKLIQYMACGLPVVASPVGVNAEIVEHGANGFLATTVDEWAQALTTLLTDAALRHRLGLAGRAKVERDYCLQVTAPRLTELLLETAKGKRA